MVSEREKDGKKKIFTVGHGNEDSLRQRVVANKIEWKRIKDVSCDVYMFKRKKSIIK